jgi:hypothetical protein
MAAAHILPSQISPTGNYRGFCDWADRPLTYNAIGDTLRVSDQSYLQFTWDGTDWVNNAPTLAAFGATSSTVNVLAALHRYGEGAPVDYTDGTPPATGEGSSPKGALYSDITGGFVYRNSGSQLQPVWTKLADAV